MSYDIVTEEATTARWDRCVLRPHWEASRCQGRRHRCPATTFEQAFAVERDAGLMIPARSGWPAEHPMTAPEPRVPGRYRGTVRSVRGSLTIFEGFPPELLSYFELPRRRSAPSSSVPGCESPQDR